MLPWPSKYENWTTTSSDLSVLVFVWFSIGCFIAFFGLSSGDLGF